MPIRERNLQLELSLYIETLYCVVNCYVLNTLIWLNKTGGVSFIIFSCLFSFIYLFFIFYIRSRGCIKLVIAAHNEMPAAILCTGLGFTSQSAATQTIGIFRIVVADDVTFMHKTNGNWNQTRQILIKSWNYGQIEMQSICTYDLVLKRTCECFLMCVCLLVYVCF